MAFHVNVCGSNALVLGTFTLLWPTGFCYAFVRFSFGPVPCLAPDSRLETLSKVPETRNFLRFVLLSRCPVRVSADVPFGRARRLLAEKQKRTEGERSGALHKTRNFTAFWHVHAKSGDFAAPQCNAPVKHNAFHVMQYTWPTKRRDFDTIRCNFQLQCGVFIARRCSYSAQRCAVRAKHCILRRQEAECVLREKEGVCSAEHLHDVLSNICADCCVE